MVKQKSHGDLSTDEKYEKRLASWLTAGLKKPGKKNVALAKLLAPNGKMNQSEISKMCNGTRKILAKHIFTMSVYIDEPIPFPDRYMPTAGFKTAPIIGSAGSPEWLKEVPTSECGVALPLPPRHAFSHLPHFATKMVGNAVNRLIPAESYAVYVPYDQARPARGAGEPVLVDGDLVLFQYEIPRHGLHRRLILKVFKENDGFVLKPDSLFEVPDMEPVKLSADGRTVHDSDDIITFIGLIVWQSGLPSIEKLA